MEHSHYSSDSKQTTSRKCLLNLLIKLGIRSARRRGLIVTFAGMTIMRPGVYSNVPVTYTADAEL